MIPRSQQQSWYLAHVAIALKVGPGWKKLYFCIDSGFKKTIHVVWTNTKERRPPSQIHLFLPATWVPCPTKDLLLLPAKHSNRTHRIVTESDDFEAKKAMRAFETSGWQEEKGEDKMKISTGITIVLLHALIKLGGAAALRKTVPNIDWMRYDDKICGTQL